jgi:hypothetical protein
MLRITTQLADDTAVLALEGRLAGPWVAEADARWREAQAERGTRPLVVDLREVLGMDEGGRALLSRMLRADVEVRVRGCAMRELVRELSAAGRRDVDEEERRT